MATGTVKWYDTEKGFGFISRDDGGGDIFVHRTALGYEIIGEGDRVQFEIVPGPRGENAAQVEILERSAAPPRPRRQRSDYGDNDGGSYGESYSRGRSESTVDYDTMPLAVGTVKWYDPDKGFGFASQDGSSEDVFVHHSALSGEIPAEGDRIEFRVNSGAKGARAEQVRIIERSGNPPRQRREMMNY
jgi:CspA family cold shock protein